MARYKCEACGATFRFREDLEEHSANVHTKSEGLDTDVTDMQPSEA